MRYICSECNLKDKIEDMKFKLNNLIEKEKHDLLHDKILKLSQQLDELIVHCTMCKNKRGQAYKNNIDDVVILYSNYMFPLKELNVRYKYNIINKLNFKNHVCINKNFKRKILV